MQRIVEQLGDLGPLDDLAGVHHAHLLGDLCDHAQVMRDQQDAHAGLGLQLAQEIEDLRLNRHV